MISNPYLVLHACVAKGNTILANFTRDPDLERLAQQCIEKAPPFHSVFSHTVRKKTYSFLIQVPFVYFAIFDEDLLQSEGIWFLNRIKCSFEEIIEGGALKGLDDLSSYCLQEQIDPIFREALTLDLTLANPSPGLDSQSSRNPSLDSVKGTKTAMLPLLPGPNGGQFLKKKKRVIGEETGDARDGILENKVDVYDVSDGVYRDFPLQKSFLSDRQKAKQTWKKHMWVVLSLDLFVCTILFLIWLWVCRGFKCIAG